MVKRKHCKYKTKILGNLKKHMANIHNIDVIWKNCTLYNYKSKRSSNIKRHKAYKHNINVTRYDCPHCDKRLKSKQDCKRHVDYMHTSNIIWHYCNECDFKSKHKGNLKRHLSCIHNIGDFYCEICYRNVFSVTTLTDDQGDHNVCRKCYNKATGKDSRVETQMSEYLDEEFGIEYLIATDNRIYGEKCQKYRPDKLYASPDRVIHVECDEKQHKDRYDHSCEERRISEIYDEFIGKDYVIIRWNPDDYNTSSKLSRKDRLKLLVDVMKFAQKMIVPNKIIVIYLFYDKTNPVICKTMQKIFISTPQQLNLETILNITI